MCITVLSERAVQPKHCVQILFVTNLNDVLSGPIFETFGYHLDVLLQLKNSVCPYFHRASTLKNRVQRIGKCFFFEMLVISKNLRVTGDAQLELREKSEANFSKHFHHFRTLSILRQLEFNTRNRKINFEDLNRLSC